MNIIRSLLFYVLFITISLLYLPQFLIARYIFRDDTLIKTITHSWAYYLLLLARKVLKITYEFKNIELITKASCPVIIASKHQSMWEAFAFFHEFGNNTIGTMKKELRHYPLINIIAPAIKAIPIDRKGGLDTLQNLIKESKKRIAEGYNICIFPEGQRTPIDKTGEYKAGLFLLYKQLKVPVVTVALNSGLYWPARSFIKKKGHITAVVTGIIDPGLSQEVFQEKMMELIERPSQELSRTNNTTNG